MDTRTIGAALKDRRVHLGIDQRDAAALIGMSRTSFSSYERDLQRPSVEVLPSLARFLEVTIDQLLVLYGATCIKAIRPSLELVLSEGAEPFAELPELPELHELPGLNELSEMPIENGHVEEFVPPVTTVQTVVATHVVHSKAKAPKSKKGKKKKGKQGRDRETLSAPSYLAHH